ncbi:MAG: aryl-sulfate sulfotransferase [Flavobacteriaceae bacterium]|nr:aryl-sulfate sulfotransferase [Flavobacteriaceae bacterium]
MNYFEKKSNFSLFGLAVIGLIFLMRCSSETAQNEILSSVTISFSISGKGLVSQESGIYELNSSITIIATPEQGYYFDRWEGFEQIVEAQEYSFIPSRHLSLKAIFLPIPEVSVEVETYTPKKMDANPVFMIRNGGRQAFLSDKTGVKLQTWNFNSNLGNDVELLPDGNLLGFFKPEEVSFGGYGGILRKLSPTGETIWEYIVNSENELLHHDFEILPNGNILLMIWERYDAMQSKSLGYDGKGPIYLEKISELNPNTFEIEWEWRSADHLIQDFDFSASNYGIIADHPEKIDLNYHQEENGDLMHANGLYFDTAREVIYLSINFYSEVWVIPHQYDTETTRGPAGDLVFRFGNPTAYKSEDERLFYNNHHPTLVEHDLATQGNFLIYVNGSNNSKSIVYEFILPPTFDFNPSNWTTPEVSWSYSEKLDL